MSTPTHRYLQAGGREILWGIHVLGAGRIMRKEPQDGGMAVRGRTLPYFALVNVTRGKGIFRSRKNKPLSVATGDVILLFPGVWHCYHSTPPEGWDETWIIFDGSWPTNLLKHGFLSPDRALVHPRPDSGIGEYFARLTDIAITSGERAHVRLAGILGMILSVLCSPSSEPEFARRERIVDIAREYFSETPDRQPDMHSLAKRLGLSYAHFRRLFKHKTGISPYRYYMNMKMTSAMRLLESGTLSVKEVAARLGFQDQYYFSRVFKKMTGAPPSQWRGMV